MEDTGIWEEGEFLVPNPVLKFIHLSKNKSWAEKGTVQTYRWSD